MITADGEVFRRAMPTDYDPKPPIVTGVGRAAYLLDREWAQGQLTRRSMCCRCISKTPERPMVREAHIDQITGVTFSMADGSTIRLGQGDDSELYKTAPAL